MTVLQIVTTSNHNV